MAREPMSAEGVGIALLVAFEVPNLFSGLLPSLFTIATFSAGDADKVRHTKRWIRRGEVQAGAVSVGLGVGASIVTKSPWPFLLVLGMIGWLVWQYECALMKGCSDGPGLDIDDPQDETPSSYRSGA
jgi:hypothetical protein